LLDLERGICQAISEVHEVVPGKFHEAVREMYSWNDVAARTEIVSCFFVVTLVNSADASLRSAQPRHRSTSR
jgi:hypothetical protein